MKLRSIAGLVVSLTLLAVIIIAFFFRKPVEYRSDQFLMDTLVSIQVYGNDEAKLRTAVQEAYAEMHRIADLADRFPEKGTSGRKSSDICRINDMAGLKPVAVDDDVIAMLELGKKFHDATGGAIDVTIGPVMDLWGFGSKNPHVPNKERLKASLALVGNSLLDVNHGEGTAFLAKSGMKLDVGALAKGYATEKAAQILKQNGIKKALIDAGGNIRVIGSNLESRPWRIGIKDPRESGEIIAVLELTNAAAVTSGDYYRYFESGGKRWHHILDPKTGYPSGKNISVTVVSADAALADVLSTAFFVLEPDKALTLARELGVEALIVRADGRMVYTPGLKDKLTLLENRKYQH